MDGAVGHNDDTGQAGLKLVSIHYCWDDDKLWLPLLYQSFLRHIYHHHLLVFQWKKSGVYHLLVIQKPNPQYWSLLESFLWWFMCEFNAQSGLSGSGVTCLISFLSLKFISGLTFIWTSNSVVSCRFIVSRRWNLKENWMLDAWYDLNVSSMNCYTHPLFKQLHFFPKQSILTVW